MKKKILLTMGALVAISLGVVGIGAFEAHVINVTAHIENGLAVDTVIIPFGTVFPQEYLEKPFEISLSSSFLEEPRVDDVEYNIVQKLKPCPVHKESCGPACEQLVPDDPTCVADDPNAIPPTVPHNPTGFHYLSLCPYLSKLNIEQDEDENTAENDIDAPSYFVQENAEPAHCITPTEASGKLTKAGNDTLDSWIIDLKVPPVAGHVGQDWPVGCPTVEQNDKTYGCDLWVEVTGISTPNNKGILTVIKQVINNNGGTGQASDFTMHVTGTNPSPSSFPGAESPGTIVSLDPGSYSVSEDPIAGYTQTLPDPNCSGSIAANEIKTCTITNDDILSPPFCGDGIKNGSEVCDDNGNNGQYGYCNADCSGYLICGNGTVENGEECDDGNTTPLDGCSATCTTEPSIRVQKVVENYGVCTKVAGDFQMKIDGGDVAQNTYVYVSTGNHTVSEGDHTGYDVEISEDCDASGNVNAQDGNQYTCIVTNKCRYGTITVTKVVVNDCGGTAVVGDFSLKVGTIPVTSGVAKNVAPATYKVSETGKFGYQAVFSGDCDSSGNITLANHDVKSCTITNNDICPVITLVKNVVGGTALPDDFNLTIDGSFVPSGSSNSVNANVAHAINEGSVLGYTFTPPITGSSFLGVPCPANLGGTITLTPGDVVTCTITNTATP